MERVEINTRVINKHDTEANWNSHPSFIPDKSELIVYDKDDNYNYPRVKIGDGVTTVVALPFIVNAAVQDIGALTIDLNSAESGTVPFTNSDMLGGLPASSYLQVADFSQALTNAGVVKSIASKVPNTSGEVTLIPDDIGAVPASRTVNGKELNNNIFLNYNDVGAAAINFYTLSFPASGWTRESNGTYTQQVSVNGLTANNNGHVDIDMSGATVDTAADIQSAWALVGRAQSINGALLLTCYGSTPEINLTVKLEVIV